MAAAGAAVVLFAWILSIGSPTASGGGADQNAGEADLPVPIVPPAPATTARAGPDAGLHLMPLYATIDGAVLHDTDPLVGAWSEPIDDGAMGVYLGIATGFSPTDVAVVQVGVLAPGEGIVAVSREGVTVAGPGGKRELTVAPRR